MMSRPSQIASLRLFLVLSAMLALLPWMAAAKEADRSKTEDSNSFARVFLPAWSRVMDGSAEQLNAYVELREIYGQMAGQEQRQAAQILSMAETLYGRYSDAEHHYAAAFGLPSQQSCSAQESGGEEAIAALGKVADTADILLVNESHSRIATRAFILGLLPQLRTSGYRYLAMEALFGLSNEVDPAYDALRPVDQDLGRRGYPLDLGKYGVYLREPVYGEIVREAARLGFSFVAYDPPDTDSRQQREQGQASIVAALANRHPGQKIFVLAGYSHVWKTDGWMAGLLSAQTKARVLSVDQVAGLGVLCAGLADKVRDLGGSDGARVAVDTRGAILASNPEQVDITVYQNVASDRNADANWLDLAGARHRVELDLQECRNRTPCLLSAHYAHEPDSAVPADRLAILASTEKLVLFLKPGKYRLAATSVNGITISRMLSVD